ncbi:MAG: methyltransferase family protein [Thermoanaerobaculia bacterium]
MSVETARPAVAAGTEDRTLVRIGRAVFRFRDLVFPLLFFPLAFAGHPLAPPGPLDRALDLLGLAVLSTGQLLRVLVMGTTYLRRGGRGRQVFADSLEQEGLFAHCRNPLYLGNLLAVAGLAVVRNALPFYLVGLPLFLILYAAIVRAEEDYLGRRFGAAYEDYERRVPRWWPRLAGLRRTLAGARLDWRAALRGEYSSAHTGIVAALLLLVWEDFEAAGWAGARPTLLASLAVWLPLAAAYLVILRRKKAGDLGRGYG